MTVRVNKTKLPNKLLPLQISTQTKQYTEMEKQTQDLRTALCIRNMLTSNYTVLLKGLQARTSTAEPMNSGWEQYNDKRPWTLPHLAVRFAALKNDTQVGLFHTPIHWAVESKHYLVGCSFTRHGHKIPTELQLSRHVDKTKLLD